MDPNQEKVDTTLKGNESNPAQTVAEGKGKGKAVDIAPQDVSMGEDDSSSDEETGAEDETRDEVEEDDEDNMEEIDIDNIVGSRTRGKTIDFAEAAKNAGDELEDDEDDDDDDFEEKDEVMHD